MKIVLVFKLPSTHAEQPPVTLNGKLSAVPLPNDEIILAGNTFTISRRTFRYFPDDMVEITLGLIFYGSTEPVNDEEWSDDLPDRIAYLRSIREANAQKVKRKKKREKKNRNNGKEKKSQRYYCPRRTRNLFASANSSRNSGVRRFSRRCASRCSSASNVSAIGSVLVIATSRHML